MNKKNLISPDLQLLECTLRDGSYAVDFRFTNEDTALLCGILSRLGFKFIEIGHGFGINASNAGKGKMPSSDKELLEIARSNVKDSKIGMFCIPKIATLENVNEMAQAGLDFIRIGNNAESIEESFPYIEVARENNLYTMLNFMKSYAIPPKEFAKKAKEAVKIGAQVIYLVDSAGGMLPEEIAEYIEEVKTAVEVKIGLHGHNNLHLATANAIQAIKSGATFIDTTLYGIGRSAGNVPTEVMLAILNNVGVDFGIDLFELMDVADKYLAPLMDRIQMHDMLSVAMGAGKFHSSFFPQVKRVAEEYKTDVRKLIYMMGKKDPSSVDEKELRETAKSLGSSDLRKKVDYDITSFYSPKIGKHYISNTLKSVADLMEGLLNASAKGRRKIVIEVVPTSEPDENLVLTEYVTSDQDMTMGRIYFGSIKMLEAIFEMIKAHVTLILIDSDNKTEWIDIDTIYSITEDRLGNYITLYSSWELQNCYILENILICKGKSGSRNLLLSGNKRQIYRFMPVVSRHFDNIFVHQVDQRNGEEFDFEQFVDNCTRIRIPIDWKHLNLDIRLALCLSFLSENEIENIIRGMKRDSYLVFGNHMLKDRAKRISNLYINVIYLDNHLAYRGQFARWMSNLRTYAGLNKYEEY